MTVKSSFGAVNLDVNAGADHPSATELQPEAPFRILLLGDFSGRADKAAMSSTGWEPVAIDRDNFDEVLARLEPGVPGMRFRDLDDFHPDRIYQESTLFQSLREVRRKLEEPSTFEEAAAEIRAWAGEQIPHTAAMQTSHPAEPQLRALPEAAPGGSLLDAIVEAAEPKAAVSIIRRDALRSFVESVVTPDDVLVENRELPWLRERVDAACSARMRTILHDSAFQALEAAVACRVPSDTGDRDERPIEGVFIEYF